MDRMTASQRSRRLSEISEKYRVLLDIDLTPLSAPRQTPSFSIPDDERKADAILGQLKIEASQSPNHPKGLKRAFTKAQKTATYTYNELYTALSRVIEDNDLPGVAEVLLKRFRGADGDINVARRASIGMVSRMRNSVIQAEPGRLIQRATELSRHEIVWLLAPLANQGNLDEALQIALRRRELAVIEILLKYGANSAPHESVFAQATEKGDSALLGLLLRTTKRVTDSTVARNLLSATISGQFNIVLLLVAAGANADHDSGSALKCAVEIGRTDIATTLVLSRNPPSAVSLDQALELVFTAPPTVINNSYDIIEVLLCAGPEGNALNESLFKAILVDNLEMIKLLLVHNADINYDRAVAIGHAIQTCRSDLVGLLVQGQQLMPELASELVSKIPENAPSADKVAILSTLLVNGASGDTCSKLLVTAAEQNDLDTARILISRDINGSPIASVDYSAGRSIQVAVARNHFDMVKLLALESTPSRFSLAKAFSAIPTPPKISMDNHFLITQTLLQAGTEGSEVESALNAAVIAQHKSTRLIELLVQSGATVSHETLSLAVKDGVIDILKILLTGSVSVESCTAAMDVAMKQHTHKVRYTIIKLLLGHTSGKESQWATQPVIEILQNCPEDIPLLRLLCHEGNANINLNDGIAVVLATKNGDPRVLDIILQSEGGIPSAETVEQGLRVALDLPLTDLHRRQKVEGLLRRAKPQRAMDESLVRELRSVLAMKQDLGVLEVLLGAGADVNSFNGAPVYWAVRDPAITELVLSKRPSAQSLAVGFQQAIKLTGPERHSLCEKLLRAGAVGEDIDRGLCIAAKEGPTALSLLQLLLPHANINYKDGRTLQIVVQQGFLDGLDLLLTPRAVMPLPATKVAAFLEAMKIKSIERRNVFVERLLKAEIPRLVISEALIAAVNSADPKLAELLLLSGASVDHSGGQAVRCAASLGKADILTLLIMGKHGSKPSLSTLSSGFGGSRALKEKDAEAYYLVLQTLLGAGAPEEAINSALVDAVKDGDRNSRLSELLYKNGASVDWKEGEALDIAVRSAAMRTLHLLLQKKPSEVVLKRVYRSTSTLSRDNRFEAIRMLLDVGKSIDKHVSITLTDASHENPPDRRLIKLLLGHQVFDEGESMAHTASILDLETFSLLMDSPKAKYFISSAFQSAMKTESLWQSYKGLSIVELMLKNGAAGDTVGQALLHAVQKLESGEDDLARDFLDTLLRYGADVNYERGQTLQRAASRVNIALIQKLLPGATVHTKATALPYLFTECEDTTKTLQCIQAFNDSLSGEDEGFFFSFQHPDSQLDPVLFLALDKFPYKPQLLRALLDTGYNPNQWKHLERDPTVGMEQWPLLCWALDQPKKKISNINLELLIEEGVNVNFTSKSGTTPLMLAIENQRSPIVKKLISKGAKVTGLDENGVTPLALASRQGNPELMEYLLEAGAECNDGSLHDAARDLRCDAMRVLIKYGHQVDYPSERHDGRSALAELCLNAVNLSPSQAHLEEAITCLVAKESDIRLHCTAEDQSEKTIFHFALDSADPLSILTVLLRIIWQVLNEDAFLYKDKLYTYSLTKYVEKNMFRGPQDQKADILRLLRNKRAVDKFWANDIEAEQPDDYCGAPPSIEEEVRVQKLRRKRMQEERENVMFRLDMKRLTTVKEVEITEIQHNADIRRDHEKAQANLYIMTQHADARLQLDLHAEGERQRLLIEKQNKEVRHIKEIGDVQLSTRRRIMEQGIEEERTKQMLQIEYVDASNEKEIEALRAKFAIEGSARQDYESSNQRQHEREIARIKMQKTLVDSSNALAANLRSGGMNQRQIGYITGEVS